MLSKRSLRQAIRLCEKLWPENPDLYFLRLDHSAFPPGRNPPTIRELVGSLLE
jgi:hypothetical protein